MTKSALVLVLALLGFVVMGYHPGAEDDGVYLAAVKADVQPGLFPHDAAFFRLQLQATVFDRWMAWFVEATRMPVPWAELLVQFLTLYVTLWAAHSIAARLFAEARAQWAGVAMLAAMFTLPVAGTALFIEDQHLHPRGVATALILMAVARILAGKAWQAAPLLVLALVMHPIMAALGISFCCVLAIVGGAPWLGGGDSSERGTAREAYRAGACFAGVLPGWVFEAPSAAWREALETRTYYFLSQWAWYAWVGAVAPLVLFGALCQWARRRGDLPMARFALAVFVYGVLQQVVALVMLGMPGLVRLTPLQPMRYLHLVYVLMALVGGGLLGRHVLKAKRRRWAVFLVVVNAGMFAAQRMEFAHSPHLELPGFGSEVSQVSESRPFGRLWAGSGAPMALRWTSPGMLWGEENAWVQAFAWIRANTPRDAYFALDPHYLESPGEDFHGFRALAERSQLADAVKDAAVVTQVPELGPAWKRQTEALAGWKGFNIQDFQRLKAEFGADWALVDYPAPGGLNCPWHNGLLAVCRIP